MSKKARKGKGRKKGKARTSEDLEDEVASIKGRMVFEVPGSGPWSSTVTLTIVIILTLAGIMFAGPMAYGFLVVPAVLFFILLLIVLPTHFCRHEIASDGIHLKYGWVNVLVPFDNVLEAEYMDMTSRGMTMRTMAPWSPSGHVLYMLKSGVGVVKIKLDRAQRVVGHLRTVLEVYINVDRPGRFARAVNRRVGVDERRARLLDGTVMLAPSGRVDLLGDTCPHCGRKQAADAAEAGEGSEGGHRIVNMFLIHCDGRLIATYTSGEVRTKDSYSVSGMLTTITDFVSDTLEGSKGTLKTLEHGDLKIIIERGMLVYLAVVVAGSVPEGLRKEMRKAIGEVITNHGASLEDWDGSLKDMEDIKKTIGQVLWV